MEKSINTMRVLSAEMITKAKSGHPGVALGAADILYALVKDHLKVSSMEPEWQNRDRFVLSAGHASSLFYATYHLMGYNISMEDIKHFRQLGSITPGHPEYGVTDGLDCTTGPLGQGISMAVGMALSEKYLANKYNKKDLKLVDHYTYVLCGDGDLQEGVALEAISFAGNFGLNKLIVLYDSNDVQLDGPTKNAISEDTKGKFIASGWNYLKVENGNDAKSVSEAISKAKSETKRPTIIECKTIIGYGCPTAGTSACHGKALSAEELETLKDNLNYHEEPFTVPMDVKADFAKIMSEKAKLLAEDKEHIKAYESKYKAEYMAFVASHNVQKIELMKFDKDVNEATRATNGKIIAEYSKLLPDLIGGSADLTASTKSKGADGDFSKTNLSGRNINYGVREHAMGAIANGITLTGLKTFTGAFFVFSDYMKPAIRMAALMDIPTIFTFSHDTIAVGEDGPTHQPIEQLAGLRAIPNLNVLRPANACETAQCWKMAIESQTTPNCILLTRQNLQNTVIPEDAVEKGAYIISKEDDKDELSFTIVASGSEVNLALETKEALKEQYNIRVVSMPCTRLFDNQDDSYQNEVLGSAPRVAVEMASSDMMFKYVDYVYDINTFGASGPMNDVLKEYGFTVEDLKEELLNLFV